jgi:hypothetical protein
VSERLQLPAEMVRTDTGLRLIRQDRVLASRASTWPRDHFPISMTITLTGAVLRLLDIRLLTLVSRASLPAGEARARPDYPISGIAPNVEEFL